MRWLLLVVVAIALHGRILGHPFVVLDDLSKIAGNRLVTDPGSAPVTELLLTPTEGYIVPVTVLVQAALWRLGHGAAWPFHLAGLLLHAAIVSLLFLFARRLLHHGDRDDGRTASAAGLLALLFAVHPIVVEPVAWATGLKDLLAALLALGGTWLFCSSVAAAAAPDRRTLRLAGGLALALLAMLAKPTVTLLGLAWLAYLGARWRERVAMSARASDGAPPASTRAPLVAALCCVGGGLALGLLSRFAHDSLLVEQPRPATFGDLHVLRALGHQLSHLLWPASLHPMYPVDLAQPALSDWHTGLGLAGLVAFGGATWSARRSPAVALGLGLAAAAYLPVSNLLPFPRVVADSYLYLPLAGLLLALGAALVPRIVTAANGRRAARERAAVVCALVLAIGYGALTWQQVGRWRGGEALWRPLIAAAPDWERPYGTLASALLHEGRFAEAARLFEQAFARGYRRLWLADFGVSLARSGRLDEAECVMLEAVHHGPAARSALRNYAVLIGNHPRRAPRYRAQAAELLPVVLAEIQAGRLQASRPLHGAISLVAHRLAAHSGGRAPAARPAAWPQGSCAVLQRTR